MNKSFRAIYHGEHGGHRDSLMSLRVSVSPWFDSGWIGKIVWRVFLNREARQEREDSLRVFSPALAGGARVATLALFAVSLSSIIQLSSSAFFSVHQRPNKMAEGLA